MADFNQAFAFTIGNEGGFADHQYDAGGKTMFGITEKVARKHGYKGDMRDLPREKAKEIYRVDYWNRLKLDDVDDQPIAEYLFDAAVNCGPRWPVKWLQEDLNALNRAGILWPDIEEDGVMGRETTGVLNLVAGGPARARLVKLLVAERTIHYKRIARGNAHNEIFLGGWLDNRVAMPT